MKKQFFITNFFAMALVLLSLTSLPISALDLTTIDCPNVILVDANHDEILFEQNAYDKAYPASITKVMTAIVVADAINNGELALYDMVTASALSQEGLSIYGSSQGIGEGETMSVIDLLHCLLVASANEVGNILGVELTGSQQGFIDLMNQKAAELGCTGTHFANSHGFHDDDHYTTAYDIYLILKEAFTYPLLTDIMGTPVYETAATNKSSSRKFYNTNALLSEWYYSGYSYAPVIGGKTGYTTEAGRCLASAAVSGDEYLIAVVLGGESVTLPDGTKEQTQFVQSRQLLQWGINHFDRRTISPGSEPITQVAVTLSENTDFVMVVAEGEISKTLPVALNLDEIQSDILLFADEVEAPVEKGQKMGVITLSYQGEIYGMLDLVAVNEVERSKLLYQQQQVMKFLQDHGVTALLLLLSLFIGAIALNLYLKNKRRTSRSRANSAKSRGSRPRNRSHRRGNRKNRRY